MLFTIVSSPSLAFNRLRKSPVITKISQYIKQKWHILHVTTITTTTTTTKIASMTSVSMMFQSKVFSFYEKWGKSKKRGPWVRGRGWRGAQTLGFWKPPTRSVTSFLSPLPPPYFIYLFIYFLLTSHRNIYFLGKTLGNTGFNKHNLTINNTAAINIWLDSLLLLISYHLFEVAHLILVTSALPFLVTYPNYSTFPCKISRKHTYHCKYVIFISSLH